MKPRTLLFSIIAVLTITMTALAAGPGRRMPAAGAGFGPGAGPGSERLAAYLELTEAQVTQWNAIREATHAQMLPLAEQRRANREALRTELDNAAPNAQRVGELVIANHELRGQSCAIRQNAQEQFVALLTPEQKEKYENFLEITRDRRGHGRGMGRGEGPAGGPGFSPAGGFGPGGGDCWTDD